MTTAVNEQLTGTYKLDPVHSSASFTVKHMVVATFRGRFEEFDAVLEDGRLTGTVNVGSIVVKDPNLAAHLQSPEFFDTERHPELIFESSEIRPDGEQVVVDGELTIKGITKPVQARGTLTGPVETLGGVHKVGLNLEAIIDRTEFGLNWNAPLPKGGFALDKDVRLIVELELAQDA